MVKFISGLPPFFLYLCIVLRTSKKRQLIGSREMGPDLLHLAKALSLPPLGSAILEPHLQRKQSIRKTNTLKYGSNSINNYFITSPKY